MKPKLTPWFPITQCPILVGEYNYKYSTGYEFRAYWDGEKWIIHDISEPDWWGNNVFVDPMSDEWRGLAEDPAKAAP